MQDYFFDTKMELYIDREYLGKISAIESISVIQQLVEKMKKSVCCIRMSEIDIFVTTNEGE